MKKNTLFACFLLMAVALPATEFCWNATNKFGNWKALRNVKSQVSSDALVLTDFAVDSQVESGKLVLDPTKYNRFSIKYRATDIPKITAGQLYYTHENGKYNRNDYWQIPSLNGNGQWHNLVLTEKDLYNPTSWFEGGMVTQFRLDPMDQKGGKIEIAEIRFFFAATGLLPKKQTFAKPLPPFTPILDEPLWPSVKPEFKENGIPVINEPYFSGKMIRSPEDVKVDSRYQDFFLRRTFELKSKPVQGWLQYTADDSAAAYLNGQTVAASNNWRITDVVEVSKNLHTGTNVLAFHYCNSRSAGGVIAELFVKFVDGEIIRIDSDKNFKTSVIKSQDWALLGFDDSSWKPAIEQQAPPTPPWVVKLPYIDFTYPQQFLPSNRDLKSYQAGSIIPVQMNFIGRKPEAPLNITISLLSNEKLLWEELFTLDAKAIQSQGGDERWRLAFDYELPQYLRSKEMTLRVRSGAIFCKSGGFPEQDFIYLEKQPEKPLTSSMLKTPYGPTMHVNGKTFFPVWGGVNASRRPDRAPRFDAPLNLHTVYCGYDWWLSGDILDTNLFDAKAELYRRISGDAYFMWDLSIYPPTDWAEKYPDEMCRDDQGDINRDGRTDFSFASEIALRDMEIMLRKAIAYLETTPYAHRIVGYRVNSGHTIEWLGWDPSGNRSLDFSPAAQKGFQKYALKHYPQLQDFSIPSREERFELDNDELLWQQPNVKLMAYYDFYSNAIADMLIHINKAAKDQLNQQKVVGTYHGYVFTLHASARSQMRAHYALKKVLDSGAVDFLMSPQAYGIRNIGGTCGDMKAFQSMRNHNILPVIEDDSRTHNGPYMDFSNNYQTLNTYQTLNVMRRNMGIAIARNQPTYYYALCNGTEFDFPEMAQDIGRIGKTGEHCLAKMTTRNAEIALVVSEESIKAMPMLTKTSGTGRIQMYNKDGSVKEVNSGGVALTSESFCSNYTRYARLGAPCDYVLAEDMPDTLGDYKLYIFINCFKYDDVFLAAIEKLRQRKVTLLWVYAPGYMHNSISSVDNMKKLTGMNLLKCPTETIPAVKLPDGRIMGTQSLRIAPAFYLQDSPEVEKIGSYLESELIGLGAVKTSSARSVFTGAYQFDVPFLTQLAKQAGVHIYSESSDPIEANSSLFTLHARFPGEKTVRLPYKTDVVDIINRVMVAKNSNSFTFNAQLHETFIFYYSDDADKLLEKLNK